jgi:glycine/D-amino acid oxidase-like deaminating enzyme
LRSTRSARLPAHGASARTGKNWQKLRTPRRNGECVRRKTRIDAARFWNQVPLAEAALPTK